MDQSMMNESGASILSPLDIGIFASSLVLSVLIGLYFANKNKTMEDYMLGGRNQSLLPVSISMMTSFVSGLTLIGNSAEFYYHGFPFSTVFISQLLCLPITAFILLPVFHRIGCVSIYDIHPKKYLEKRFHLLVRTIVSFCFMLKMVLYNAVVLFVPSLSLQTLLGISPSVSIGVVGTSCLIYSTFGGVKAIIWTDFFQALLMYLSVVCIAVGGVIEAGGLPKLFEINLAAGRFDTNDYLTFDINTRHTIYTIIIGATITNTFSGGASQIQVQRALSLPSLRLSQWSQLLSGIFSIIIMASCTFLGLILTATYIDCDPFTDGRIEKRDSLIFYYLTNHLLYIPGLRGLFVAGIFAATLSTLSSYQNSMSALMMMDFIKPLLDSYNKRMSGATESWLTKLIGLLFGLVCIGLSFVVGEVSGLLQVAITLSGVLGGPVLSAFLLGMLTRFTNTIGVICGMILGFVFGCYVQIYQTFHLPALESTMRTSVSGCPGSNSTNTTSFLLLASGQRAEIESSLTEVVIDTNIERFLGMSYYWLPVFGMIITCTVAIVISALTGGLYQDVDDEYLVAWIQRRKITKQEDDAQAKIANIRSLNKER